MSLPVVPNITPDITLTAEDAYNMLLISIAMEEIGLSHIINAEAEKIQFVLGTLHACSEPGTMKEIMLINKEVRATLDTVLLEEMLLYRKLNTIVNMMHK
ncbi:hypothetical protein [Paenibacillus sp. FJAT-26967]|uniref:hypothetical protein n=1 Tax=Paenibacillus sp. FJAT-26967 TaxID=1729690 RepID=UPI000837B8CF|nr:hypothetical protein [Paenibacillus sp. FJAT-26967]